MELLRIVVRSLTACVLTELVITALAQGGWDLSWRAYAFSLGWGLGTGGALATAEVALRRVGVMAALLLGATLSPLAILGSVFQLALVDNHSSHAAALEVGRIAGSLTATGLAGHVLAHLFVGGPLLVALRRRATLPGQCAAMGLGATLWCLLVLLVGPPIAGLVDARSVPLLLLTPCLVLPAARQLGDRLLRRLLRRQVAASKTSRWRTSTWLAALVVVSAAPLPTLSLRRGPTAAADEVRAAARVLLFDDFACALGRPHPLLVFPWPYAAWQEGLGGGVDALRRCCYSRTGPRESAWLAPVEWAGWRLQRAECLERAAVRGDLSAMQELAGLYMTSGHSLVSLFRPETPEERLEALGWLRQLVAAGREDLSCTLGSQLVRLGRWGPPILEGQAPSVEAQLLRSRWTSEGLELLRRAHARGDDDATDALLEALRTAPRASPADASARADEARAIELAPGDRARARSPLGEALWRTREAHRGHSSGVGSVGSAR